jgi:hypothetical protein
MAQRLGQATVDTTGRFQARVTLPQNARTGPIAIQARVPNDLFGLDVYAQARPFTILPTPPPWYVAHPRLVWALRTFSVPLTLALVAAGFFIWRRMRRRVARPV